MERKLKEFFGFDSFRHGQKEAIEAVLRKHDVAVFISTGAGKSLCYQFPALYKNKTVAVVSPLISLMQDQVMAINRKFGNVACFLGSAQSDYQVEEDAANGKYLIIYMTPEKLTGGFSRKLSNLFDDDKLLALAVDEAHCASEWGHDFRPSYRKISDFRDAVPRCPIIALTATAVNHVKKDLVSNLKLRDPRIIIGSIDRPNFKISCVSKASLKPKIEGHLEHIIANLKKKPRSTIVYCATRASVENVANVLATHLGQNMVDMYHAGMSDNDRAETHIRFLTDQTLVIVATLAFGMGIDKPDIRQIVHYEPPKSMEEYFQQIGRAGRDGTMCEVTLIYADSDFARFHADFYCGTLPPDAKTAYMKSLNAMQDYTNDKKTCRRMALVKYFSGGSEQLPNGERCGICDNCVDVKKMGDDFERNFAVEANFLMTTLIRQPMAKSKLVDSMNMQKKSLPDSDPIATRTGDFWTEMLPMLAIKGFIDQKEIKYPGRRAYFQFSVSQAGYQFLSNSGSTSLFLPVPASLRKHEAGLKAKRDLLVEQGIDLATIPEDELLRGAGSVIDAELKFIRFIQSMQEKNAGKAAAYLAFLDKIFKWRKQQAIEARVAPGSIFSDTLGRSLAYVLPHRMEDIHQTLGKGNFKGLFDIVLEFRKELGMGTNSSAGSGANAVIFRAGSFKAKNPPMHILSKVTKEPKWKSSYNRYAGGESLQKIAMTQPNGKPILSSTVKKHILTAGLHGFAIDINRLQSEAGTPPLLIDEWQMLDKECQSRGIDSGGIAFNKGSIVKTMCEDPSTQNLWYQKVDLYEFLKLVKYFPNGKPPTPPSPDKPITSPTSQWSTSKSKSTVNNNTVNNNTVNNNVNSTHCSQSPTRSFSTASNQFVSPKTATMRTTSTTSTSTPTPPSYSNSSVNGQKSIASPISPLSLSLKSRSRLHEPTSTEEDSVKRIKLAPSFNAVQQAEAQQISDLVMDLGDDFFSDEE